MLAGIHDITIGLIDICGEVGILAFEVFQLGLEDLLITCLLLNLLFEVLTQVSNAVFERVFALLDLLDTQFESLV